MDEFDIGPNASLIYCMEFLVKNLAWLKEALEEAKCFDSKQYVLFDFPGQIELYTHRSEVSTLVEALASWGFRLVCIHLVDALHCLNVPNFISSSLYALSAMFQLELPHLNVISKIDLLKSSGEKLHFDLRTFLDNGDFGLLKDTQLSSEASVAGESGQRLPPRFAALHGALCNVLNDYALVSYATLNISDKQSVHQLMRLADKSVGYVYGGFSAEDVAQFDVAAAEPNFELFKDWDIQDVPVDAGVGDTAVRRDATLCAVCDAKGTKKCARCGVVRYCSREHQLAHWPAHKRDCCENKRKRK